MGRFSFSPPFIFCHSINRSPKKSLFCEIWNQTARGERLHNRERLLRLGRADLGGLHVGRWAADQGSGRANQGSRSTVSAAGQTGVAGFKQTWAAGNPRSRSPARSEQGGGANLHWAGPCSYRRSSTVTGWTEVGGGWNLINLILDKDVLLNE